MKYVKCGDNKKIMSDLTYIQKDGSISPNIYIYIYIFTVFSKLLYGYEIYLIQILIRNIDA
jgi:hypothetical protein